MQNYIALLEQDLDMALSSQRRRTCPTDLMESLLGMMQKLEQDVSFTIK